MFNWLRGKRTYIVALAMVTFAVTGLFLGKVTDTAAVQLIGTALGLAGLRVNLPVVTDNQTQ